MVETLLALFFLGFVFFVAFAISQLVEMRTLLDHAAARAARARTVGFNSFMCQKAAKVAMIPIAGERLLPEGAADEVSLVPIYLESDSPGRAAAILDYERWHSSRLDLGDGLSIDARVRMGLDFLWIEGRSRIESHYPLYMVHGGG